MPDPTPPINDPQRLPIATTMLGLTAMAALYVTSKGFVGLPIMAVALVATYFTPARIPASPLLAWAVRVVVFFTLLLTANPQKRPDVGSVAFDPSYTNLLGYAMAAEFVIRAWMRRRGGPSKGEMVLLSALVLTAATNAGDMRAVTWVRVLAPVYLVFLVTTLRRFRDRPRGFSVGWVAALLFAVSIGMTSSWAVTAFEGQITRWSMQFLSGKGRESSSIGLGRTATLGRMFNPNPSTRRVLKVVGWPGEHHLRVMTFDQYSGGTWGPPIDQRDFGPVTPDQLAPPAFTGRREVHVTRYDNAFGLLCLPLETASLHVASETAELLQDPTGCVKIGGDDAVDPLDYSFTLAGRQGAGVLSRPITEPERKWDLIVPDEIDPAVQLIADRVATGKTPTEKLARIGLYLQSNHHYSLEIDPGDGEPISTFLLKKLDGHCEYFAASVVILARCAGIPARYVTGYYAHEPAGDDTTVVRDRDAHAWAECWVDGTGWVTVDATPSGGMPDVLFTETPAWRRYWERAQDVVAAVRTWLARRTLMEGAVMIAVLAAIPVLIRAYKGRSSKQRKLVLATLGPPTPELASLVRRFERLLRRRQIAVPPNRTWREHLPTLPGYADFVHQYNALRFGNEGSVQSLTQTLERLERTPAPLPPPSS